VSIISTLVIFLITSGLTQYYSSKILKVKKSDLNEGKQSFPEPQVKYEPSSGEKLHSKHGELLFVIVYASLLLFILFFPSSNGNDLFVPWNDLGVVTYVQIIISIAFCFFLPGWAILLSIEKYLPNLRTILKLL